MRKKGFTLIELLAVIVILSVIALITTPMILGIIETARRSSFKATCTEIYNSYDMYVASDNSIEKNNSNIIFDFSSKRQNTEIIGDIKYEPVSKLYLKGELPKYGLYQIKNDKKTLKVDNGKYTCIIDEKTNEILEGTVEENDTTSPVINDITLTSTTNSIKIVVDAIEEDGVIVKYYYRLNGEETISENNSQSYKDLKPNEEYEIEVVVENKSGLKSNKVVKKITTKNITNPTIKQTSQVPTSEYSYVQSRIIQITYSNTNITSPVYYFKSSVAGTVTSGVVTASCGTGTTPGSCTSSNVTTLVAGTWYKTTSQTPSIVYKANGTLYALTSDGKNISGTSTYTISKIDTSIPTTPTITYNGGSNTCSWKNNYNITLTSTATSGIHHYEVDWDGDGVANQASSSNFIPGNGYSSCNNRFRAVSNSGVAGAWTESQHIHMDTIAPGVTTITYNSGANTCTWKNNYNLTLTASDNMGVSCYQIDTNNDGIADAQTASNFIPANGYHSHTVRFRAVDYAGNIGPWTENHHIHMDTENPVHTNWWWGEVTKDVARLYVQATDSVGLPNSAATYDGHNAGVYCPTSTQSGGYANWVWFKGNWDASANAYRCDITPSTFGHYGQTYITHLYIYDYAGNGGYYNATSVSIPSNDYAATNASYAATRSCNNREWCNCPHGNQQGPGHCNYDISEGISVTWGGSCSYTCPNGGTLSGTTCVRYTCPDGGTLSGTTCVR